jgi:hypothetical protein
MKISYIFNESKKNTKISSHKGVHPDAIQDDSKKTWRKGVKKNEFTKDRIHSTNTPEFDPSKGWPEEGIGKGIYRIKQDNPSFEGNYWFHSNNFNDDETNKRPIHPEPDYLNPEDVHTGDDYVEIHGVVHPLENVDFEENNNSDSENYDEFGYLDIEGKGGHHLVGYSNINEGNNNTKNNIKMKNQIQEQIDRIKQMMMFEEGMSYKDVKMLTEQDKEAVDGGVEGGAEGGSDVGAVDGGAEGGAEGGGEVPSEPSDTPVKAPVGGEAPQKEVPQKEVPQKEVPKEEVPKEEVPKEEEQQLSNEEQIAELNSQINALADEKATLEKLLANTSQDKDPKGYDAILSDIDSVNSQIAALEDEIAALESEGDGGDGQSDLKAQLSEAQATLLGLQDKLASYEKQLAATNEKEDPKGYAALQEGLSQINSDITAQEKLIKSLQSQLGGDSDDKKEIKVDRTKSKVSSSTARGSFSAPVSTGGALTYGTSKSAYNPFGGSDTGKFASKSGPKSLSKGVRGQVKDMSKSELLKLVAQLSGDEEENTEKEELNERRIVKNNKRKILESRKQNKKVIKLNESDLYRILDKVLREQKYKNKQ